MDPLLYILKYLGIVISGAAGILGIVTEHKNDKKELTNAGKWSVGILLFALFGTLIVQTIEVVKASETDKAAQNERVLANQRREEEIARILLANQRTTERVEVAVRRTEESLAGTKVIVDQNRELANQNQAITSKAESILADLARRDTPWRLNGLHLTIEIAPFEDAREPGARNELGLDFPHLARPSARTGNGKNLMPLILQTAKGRALRNGLSAPLFAIRDEPCEWESGSQWYAQASTKELRAEFGYSDSDSDTLRFYGRYEARELFNDSVHFRADATGRVFTVYFGISLPETTRLIVSLPPYKAHATRSHKMVLDRSDCPFGTTFAATIREHDFRGIQWY